MVSHIGDCSFTGHYISDVFDCKECEWKSYNDSTVSKASSSLFCFNVIFIIVVIILKFFLFTPLMEPETDLGVSGPPLIV